MTIIYWTISWLAGIWLASAWNLPIIFWLMAGLLPLIGAILLRRHPIESVTLICLTAVTFGAARYNLATQQITGQHIAHYNGTKNLVLTGIVNREPSVRETSLELFLDVDSLREENGPEIPLEGEILVRAKRYPPIPYGARVSLSGDLETPQNYSDFDYRQYLARQGIFSVMEFPAIEILATGSGNPAVHLLLRIKAHAQETINHLLPGPEAALLSGILLGNEAGLSKELQEDFQITGMTHIIAISGFNIAIIAGIFLLGSRHIASYRLASWIALAGVAIYTIFVGAEASVVRAAVMAAFVILATQIMGRPIFYPATVFTAALLMTLINPMLLWDVGFQLSFAATLGLTLYIGPWSRKFESALQPHLAPNAVQRSTRLVSELLLATMAAMIMTLPIILYHFGTLSLISPLANLLILPAQPGVMLWGGLAAILGSFLPILGQISAWIAWLFLNYTTSLVHFFAGLPLASVPISFPFSSVVAVYSLILGATWWAGQDREKRDQLLGKIGRTRLKRAGLAALIIPAILIVIWLRQRPDGRLHVVFFDVGQGDATFIQTPDGRQILVDGGQYSSILLDNLGAEMPFWDKEIDILVATHPDVDHYLGLIGVLESYRVGMLITNGQAADTAEYETLLTDAQDLQIPIHRALVGEVIELDSGVHLEVLHPSVDLEPDQDNDNSISMRLDYEDFSLLLTGDVEFQAEQQMLGSGRPLQALVYKAGHHGANTSSSALFLEAVRPQFVIISAGEGNTYGHPHQEMLERAEAVGAAVLRTDQQGTMEVITDGQVLWWKMNE